MKREYHHTEGRNAVILICNFISVGMDLLQCATNLSAALKVVGSLPEIPRGLVILYSHCRVLLETDGLVKHKLY